MPFALVVGRSLPVQTLPEFIAYAKSNPGLAYGSAGNGSPQHPGAEMLKAAAHSRGLPLGVLDVEGQAAGDFDGALVLSRPDQHVAWGCDSLPADPLALIDRVRGASN